jgi:hypothetical protein
MSRRKRALDGLDADIRDYIDCCVPALTAARVDPATILRYD